MSAAIEKIVEHLEFALPDGARHRTIPSNGAISMPSSPTGARGAMPPRKSAQSARRLRGMSSTTTQETNVTPLRRRSLTAS